MHLPLIEMATRWKGSTSLWGSARRPPTAGGSSPGAKFARGGALLGYFAVRRTEAEGVGGAARRVSPRLARPSRAGPGLALFAFASRLAPLLNGIP